eukprot:1140225-Pelagomonas_calceolata.AAC.3
MMIPAHNRDIHLVKLKYCPDTNPLPSLQKSADQHASTISRLRTQSLRNPNRNNKGRHWGRGSAEQEEQNPTLLRVHTCRRMADNNPPDPHELFPVGS